MADVSGLGNALDLARQNLSQSPGSAARETEDAIINFWESMMGPGGSSVKASAAKGLISPIFESVWASRLPVVAAIALQMATVINVAFPTLILAGGSHGGHISVVSFGLPALGPAFIAAWINPRNTGGSGQDEAKGINAFSINSLAIGTGVGSPPPPSIGPLS